ncbi:MAG: glutamate mutase L [Anaerolineales bacterium]|nr:glutamate mutase L [Anaerolineales bacterium]
MMAPAFVEKDSFLAVDVGSATTRAMLFDVVAGRYRFIAIGQSPSTAHAPFKDIGEGVQQAIENLQQITGRKLMDTERNIITSAQPDGSGVDAFAATLSAGPALNIVVAGLLAQVSLASTIHLAESTYGRITETLSLNDARSPQEQIDAIIRARPDLIIIAGGTDGGATRSLQDLLEVIGLACYLLPQDKRPAILYAGNKAMQTEMREALGSLTSTLHTTSNIRPSVETEDLQPARKELARTVIDIRKRHLRGVDALDMWAGGNTLPSAFAEGRILNFLSRLYGDDKAVLSVNLGASATTVSAGFGNQLTTSVYPHLGMGAGLADLQKYTSLENISRWLPLDIHPQSLTDYLYQKALYPNSIPATEDDLRIEQALAREVLRLALQQAHKKFDRSAPNIRSSLLPLFEVILAGGSVLTNTPSLGQSLLLLLDAIQPVGVSTIILDQNNLLPALGVAASTNALLPVQVLESGAFVTLATTVSPVSSARYGAKILRARLTYDDGTESGLELKQGGFENMPLRIGQSARLTLQPLQRTDIGLGSGKRTSLRVNGSALGLILDGRERPLNLTSDPVRRRELLKKWLWTLGG